MASSSQQEVQHPSDRRASVGLWEPDVILKQQFWARFSHQSWQKPEKRLMVAVLETAVDELQGNVSVRGLEQQQVYEEAHNWIFSDDSDDHGWPFSFVNICESLGIEHEWLRAGLKQWISRMRDDCATKPSLKSEDHRQRPAVTVSRPSVSTSAERMAELQPRNDWSATGELVLKRMQERGLTEVRPEDLENSWLDPGIHLDQVGALQVLRHLVGEGKLFRKQNGASIVWSREDNTPKSTAQPVVTVRTGRPAIGQFNEKGASMEVKRHQLSTWLQERLIDMVDVFRSTGSLGEQINIEDIIAGTTLTKVHGQNIARVLVGEGYLAEDEDGSYRLLIGAANAAIAVNDSSMSTKKENGMNEVKRDDGESNEGALPKERVAHLEEFENPVTGEILHRTVQTSPLSDVGQDDLGAIPDGREREGGDEMAKRSVYGGLDELIQRKAASINAVPSEATAGANPLRRTIKVARQDRDRKPQDAAVKPSKNEVCTHCRRPDKKVAGKRGMCVSCDTQYSQRRKKSPSLTVEEFNRLYPFGKKPGRHKGGKQHEPAATMVKPGASSSVTAPAKKAPTEMSGDEAARVLARFIEFVGKEGLVGRALSFALGEFDRASSSLEDDLKEARQALKEAQRERAALAKKLEAVSKALGLAG